MYPEALTAALAFAFGAIVGSFLNVVSLRFNTGVGLGGRSKCMSCGKPLSWHELVPILSYALQGGACRKCGSRISAQYPIVETATGVIFAMIALRFPPVSLPAAADTFIYLAAASLLVVIAAYDAKHKIIPDPFVFAFAGLALAGAFIGGGEWFRLPSLVEILAGPAIALPFALLWAVSNGRWMGFGDAKLALGIGWLLGMGGGANAVIMAFWIGAAASVAWMLASRRRFERRVEVPFGPYLIIGALIVLLSDARVFDVNALAALFRV